MKILFILLMISVYTINGQTSDQIKKAKEIIKDSGMTKNEVRNAAKARGYTDKQINAVLQKEKGLNNDDDIVNQFQDVEATEDISKNNKIEDNVKDKESLDLIAAPKDLKGGAPLKYFGYDIFLRDPSLFQSTSIGLVDPSYLIGPDDEIIIMLWGETQFRQVLKVDKEGFVFIPEIGQVFVNGLNLSLLESKLFRVFSQSYDSLDPVGRKPTTFLDVSLGNLRPLRIQVLGEVAQPGAYLISPFSTLFSALYYFNGPKYSGSLRDIHLIRGGEKIAAIDFYEFLLTGKKPNDLKLQFDDIIFIPPRKKTITVSGEIKREGIFELKPDETLVDLIRIAGGLKSSAYLSRALVDRIATYQERDSLQMDRIFKDVNLENILQQSVEFVLNDNDKIKIFSILDVRENVVDITGAVIRPGKYELKMPMRLNELINKADGLMGDAFLDRVHVIRTNPDFTEQLIKLNLKLALEGDLDNNIILQGFDRVRIFGTSEMVAKKFVSILGHVMNPGTYDLQDNMRIYDLIFKAGGILDDEFMKKAFLGRGDLLRLNDDGITRNKISFNLGKVIDSYDSDDNILLKPSDVVRLYDKNIFIAKRPVSIFGRVRNPGDYWLHNNMTLKDLILLAGGLKENVYMHKVEIVRINPYNKDFSLYADTITFNIDDKLSMSSSTVSSSSVPSSSKIDKFYLKEYDIVTIRVNGNFDKSRIINISGEVVYPGDYAILDSEEKVSDVIKRAGGINSNANLNASIFIRDGKKINLSIEDLIENNKSKLNFTIKDKDQIIINSFSQIVTIEGEVNLQGGMQYYPGKRLRYYLKTSGGLTLDAEKKNIWIEYPSGKSKKYNRFSIFSPRVEDGSKIKVGKKKDVEKFDFTEYAKDLTAILGNLAQVLVLANLADR